jgi:hypothetical protein
MKSLLLTLLSCCTMLQAQFNPKMRNNFGANHATFRVNAGYYGNIYQDPRRSPENEQSTAVPKSMLSSLRLNVESMVMTNNRYGFSESVSRNPAKFVLGRVSYDGFTNTGLATLAFAKSFKCMTTFPLMGQIKGFWGIGATGRYMTNETQKHDWAKNTGTRLSLNIYNKTSALQAETYVFSNGVIVNILAYRKLAENFLFNIGVENNLPKAGFSGLIGSSRLSVYAQMHKKDVQGGVNLTINL